MTILRRLLLVLLFAYPCCGTLACGTSSGTDAGTVASTTLAYGSSPVSGDEGFVLVRIGGSSLPTGLTVSDNVNAGNYLQAGSTTLVTSLGNVAIFYKENMAAGATTVTVSYSSTAQTLRVAEIPCSGLATSSSIDQTTIANGSSTSPASGSVTTTQTNELLIGLAATANNSSETWTAATSGGTWTIQQQVGGNKTLLLETLIVSATGSYNHNPTMNVSDIWVSQIATFKALAAGLVPCAFKGKAGFGGKMGCK